MKKLSRVFRYLLPITILCILTYCAFRIEKISSVQSFFNKISGILNTEWTAIGILLIIIGTTIFSIIYVIFHDKENDQRKKM